MLRHICINTFSAPPKNPTLTGPTSVVTGQQYIWTCVSIGAYPEQTMSMREGNNNINSGFVTNSDYNSVTKLYTMTGTLTWSPTNSNQDTLNCDVMHTQTLGQNPQTAVLPLSVQCELWKYLSVYALFQASGWIDINH